LIHGYRFGNLCLLRIISKAAIIGFSKKYADAAAPLTVWYQTTLKAEWQHLAEVRKDFPHADFVQPFTVFNIGGNKYRLIAVIKYRWQIVYIRHILTHKEYSEEKWKV
jgi:mRNA interferase HigB